MKLKITLSILGAAIAIAAAFYLATHDIEKSCDSDGKCAYHVHE